MSCKAHQFGLPNLHVWNSFLLSARLCGHRSVLSRSIPKEWIHPHSPVRARVGQQAAQKKGNWKEFEQSQSRTPRDKGLFSYRILLPEMSRWGHCGFIFSISGKNLIWLPQSFPSPQLQACSIACFSVGEQRIGNGLSFFFFYFTQQLWYSPRQEGNWTMRAADVEFLF